MLAPVERQRPGEPGDRVLGRRVRRRVRPRRVRRDRAVVDDPAPARRLRLHLPERRLRAQERAGQVDVDDVPPLLERQVLERAADADAGVVEQQVDAAERAPCVAANSASHRRRVGDVGRHRERARRVAAGVDDRLLQRLASAARQRDAPAVAQQRDGDGLADAGAGAGDDGDLARSTHRDFLPWGGASAVAMLRSRRRSVDSTGADRRAAAGGRRVSGRFGTTSRS